MITSLLTNTKNSENIKKANHNVNCLCHLDENFSREKFNMKSFYNIRQNKYNNHVLYDNNIFSEKNNNSKSSEEFYYLNKLSTYQNDSKSKKEEDKSKYMKYLKYKKINENNNQNISKNYHSYENKKNEDGIKYNIRNICKNNDTNNANLKYIKLNHNASNTPKINKNKGYIEHKITGKLNIEKEELSKTYHYKNKTNYEYREIKDMKRVKNYQLINNFNKKENIFNNSQKILLNNKNFNNNQVEKNDINLRNSLTLINNKNINSNIQNNENKYINNNSYKLSSTNQNIKKYSNANIQLPKNYIKNKDSLIKFENSYQHSRNINNLNRVAAIKKENNYKLIKNNIGGTPEKSNKLNNQVYHDYPKRNDYLKKYDTDRDYINTSRYNSSEFKETSTDVKTLKNNNNIVKKKLSPKIRINKELDLLTKKNYIKNFNHEKKNSDLNNYNTINTEKIYLKNNEKYDINHIFKINNNNNHNMREFKGNKNEKNAELNNNLNLKNNSKGKFNNKSIILNTNKKVNYINNIKSDEKQNNSLKNIYYFKNLDNDSNKYNFSNTDVKELNKKLFNKNYEKNKINNYIIKNNNKNNILPSKEIQKSKKKIYKKCRSLEKEKNEKINKKLKINHHRKSLTKSKSRRKHSKCIKYIDNLKIFKFSETGYNINNNNESSTNCTKNSNLGNKYRKYMIKSRKSQSKKKKNINSFNLQYKTYEEDIKIKNKKLNDLCKYLKPQISCRITLSKKNNVHIKGITRYFKINYYCSENLRNDYDADSEDTSEYYNNIF